MTELPALTPVFRLELRFAPPLRYPSVIGERAFLRVLEGRAEGAVLTGEVADDGGDWAILRADGAAEIEGRMMIRASDGTLVYWRSRGVLRRTTGGELAGDYRLTPYFDTPVGAYDHLTRTVFVATGRLAANRAALDVYGLD